MHPFLPYWLAASYLPLSSNRFLELLPLFKDINHLFHASDDELNDKQITESLKQAIKSPAWELIEKDLLWAERAHCHLITYDSSDYPALLKAIPDPPILFYVVGNLDALKLPQIAIVGARNATPTGVANAEQFAACLAEYGLAITSGMALGIDGAAHRGALKVNGITIAVVGSGLNHIYPCSHRGLQSAILDAQGAIVSEFALDRRPQAMNFPRRNRVISGLSMGVFLVEAAERSGSLITAKHALDQGREVFAMPGSIHHPLARGCNKMIKMGAKLVESAVDILEELGHFKREQREMPSKDKVPDGMLSLIGYELTSLDMILLQTGLTVTEVSSMLLTLELNGFIRSVPGGYVRLDKGFGVNV